MKLPENAHKPYRLGVALSGGGARGFAHIGALRALRELGLRPDIIAGVSAGSVAAAFYAAGMLNDPDDDPLLKMFMGSKVSKFVDVHVPKESFFSLKPFIQKLADAIPYKNIEDLPLPTVICATDLDAGTKKAFTSGPLAERVAASCSIPIIFEPLTIDGHRYVDGGVLHNLPAWALRHQCDRLIGINCSPLAATDKPATSIIEIAHRSYDLMSKHNAIPDMELCDQVVNLTESATHQVFDLHDLELVIASGYLTTIKTLS